MAEEQFILTQAGYDNLKTQLQDLEAERVQAVDNLNDNDDDSGNLEGEEAGMFYEAKTSLEHIDERIGHLRYILQRAQVTTEDPDPKRVDHGEEVTVYDLVDRKERVFVVLDGEEAQMTYNRMNRDGTVVSGESPVGQVLLGAAIGDVIEVTVPDGTARYAVRSISRPE